TVYPVQSQPKQPKVTKPILVISPATVTKPILVIGPAAVESYRAIQSLLEHCPTLTGCCLVTVYIKGTRTIRIDCINTAG
ncbi:hypothetical protein pdam_00002798, partial [Pocillopora damicornis]